MKLVSKGSTFPRARVRSTGLDRSRGQSPPVGFSAPGTPPLGDGSSFLMKRTSLAEPPFWDAARLRLSSYNFLREISSSA